MKKLIIIALAAISLFSCGKKDNVSTEQKNLEFGLGISTLQSKSTGGSASTVTAAAVRNAITNVHFELLNSSGSTLQTIAIDSDQLAAIKRGDNILIADIPYRTTQVVAWINTTTENLVNKLQANSDIPYPLETMVYTGKNTVTKTGQVQDGKEVWEAIVDIYPAMSRFEILGQSADITPITQPADIPDATRAQAEDEFGTYLLLKAEESARDNWIAANGQPTDPFTYKYAITFENLPNYNMLTVSGVYANNFIEDKSKPAVLGFNDNNGAGNWNNAAVANYANGGKHDKMWDAALIARPDVVAYNLFPQTTNKTDLSDFEKEMPHIILRLEMAGGQAPLPTTATRWITMRSFNEKLNPTRLVTAFMAGTAYQLDLSDLRIRLYRATLVVTAVADGKEEPGDPEVDDNDDTDPNPEQTDGAILRVGLVIKNWRIIGVVPNL